MSVEPCGPAVVDDQLTWLLGRAKADARFRLDGWEVLGESNRVAPPGLVSQMVLQLFEAEPAIIARPRPGGRSSTHHRWCIDLPGGRSRRVHVRWPHHLIVSWSTMWQCTRSAAAAGVEVEVVLRWRPHPAEPADDHSRDSPGFMMKVSSTPLLRQWGTGFLEERGHVGLAPRKASLVPVGSIRSRNQRRSPSVYTTAGRCDKRRRTASCTFQVELLAAHELELHQMEVDRVRVHRHVDDLEDFGLLL